MYNVRCVKKTYNAKFVVKIVTVTLKIKLTVNQWVSKE